jgi:sugar phosphate permease
MAVNRSLYGMFLVLYAGYTMIVYVRQSVSYAAPVITESEKLADSDLGKMLYFLLYGIVVIRLEQ